MHDQWYRSLRMTLLPGPTKDIKWNILPYKPPSPSSLGKALHAVTLQVFRSLQPVVRADIIHVMNIEELHTRAI